MRGKGVDVAVADTLVGITPAWAGKRFWNRPWVWATSDHPRVGGEKAASLAGLTSGVGSPPRGRGKVYPFRVGPVAVRITPAWAGKSDSPPVCGWVWEDHPRVGGEKPIRP